MQFKIFKFKTVKSTNEKAISLIRKQNHVSGFVYSERQTKGRGTHGKSWVSKKGNLFGTIFFQLKKNYPSFAEFSIINPVIISNILKNFCKIEDISIKSPNDLFIKRKKVCGILQEVVIKNDKKFLIIGIGLNILSNPSIKKNYKATNLLSETKKKASLQKIIKMIITSYKNFFLNLNEYNFIDFKKKAESIALSQVT